jgi:hypothetical protein
MRSKAAGAEMMPRLGQFVKEAAADRFLCVILNIDEVCVVVRS